MTAGPHRDRKQTTKEPETQAYLDQLHALSSLGIVLVGDLFAAVMCNAQPAAYRVACQMAVSRKASHRPVGL
jgi:hypothetical protein